MVLELLSKILSVFVSSYFLISLTLSLDFPLSPSFSYLADLQGLFTFLTYCLVILVSHMKEKWNLDVAWESNQPDEEKLLRSERRTTCQLNALAQRGRGDSELE